MIIRPARLTDFDHLETFVWQAIFPAFDVDGLTPPQRAENDALVEDARTTAVSAFNHEQFGVFVAVDPKLRTLAGYIIADARPKAYAEIVQLIVKRSFHGKGVGELLLEEATEFIGRDRAVSLAVRHYNARAIAFFVKHGFEDTGETTGDHAIARTLMLREAFARPGRKTNTMVQDNSFGQDFPSAADEPVFEALPDYTLATDETPMFQTGANALRVEENPAEEPETSYLTEDQLSVLEAFIAKARAKKAAEKSTSPEPETTPGAATPEAKTSMPGFDRSKITFEVDYGENQDGPSPSETRQGQATEAARPAVKPSFAFDFSPVKKDLAAVEEHVVSPVNTAADRAAAPQKDVQPSSGAFRGQEPDAARDSSVVHQEAEVNDDRSTTRTVTKNCPDCSTALPAAARFCYVCGMPQSLLGDTEDTPSLELHQISDQTDASVPDDPEDELELTELPPLPEEPVGKAKKETIPDQTAVSDNNRNTFGEEAVHGRSSGSQHVTITDLRKAYTQYFQDQIQAYFGDKKVSKYLERMDKDAAFRQVRDGSLNSLAQWLSAGPSAAVARVRKQNTFADLTEYFIVETAADLSDNVLPQRLLRHQSSDWQTADIFRMVMDYLDFDAEAEVVYTDFVTMPARALKNATRSFLHAAKDERVFFICDQSLISQAKNGFAVTDSGIYWKNVLQPTGSATFTTMREVRIEHGHLVIDGQFFDAGGRLNLKVAVLLNKLRRMR